MRFAKPLPWIFALSVAPTMVASRLSAAQFGVVARPDASSTQQGFDKGNFGQLTMLAARKRCEDALDSTLDLVDQAADLTEPQRSKLALAGQIDIHRFFADYQSLRRRLPSSGRLSRDEWQAKLSQIRDEAQPLKMRYHQGLHGQSSVLRKSLVTTLDAEQQHSVEELFRKRARNVYLNDIRATLAVVDRIVPLTRKQRSRISNLLLSRTQPPAGSFVSTAAIEQVLSRMAQVEQELRNEFSEQEWAVISKLIQAGREAQQ